MRKTRFTDEQIVGFDAGRRWLAPFTSHCVYQSRALRARNPALAVARARCWPAARDSACVSALGLLQVNPTAIVHAPLDPKPWTAQMAAPAPGQQELIASAWCSKQ